MEHSMEKVSAREVRDHMASILNHVAYGGKRYTLTRHGQGVAVIISLEEWKAVERLLQKLEDEEDIRDADAAIERIKKGEKTLSHEELKRELGL
jgi:prevent-host-death family protein